MWRATQCESRLKVSCIWTRRCFVLYYKISIYFYLHPETMEMEFRHLHVKDETFALLCWCTEISEVVFTLTLSTAERSWDKIQLRLKSLNQETHQKPRLFWLWQLIDLKLQQQNEFSRKPLLAPENEFQSLWIKQNFFFCIARYHESEV